MAVSMSEAYQRIKLAGVSCVRTVPMPGQSVHDGMYRIEIKEGSGWVTLVESLPRSAADDIVKQATNRVILG